jgi:hypothetical protein
MPISNRSWISSPACLPARFRGHRAGKTSLVLIATGFGLLADYPAHSPMGLI